MEQEGLLLPLLWTVAYLFEIIWRKKKQNVLKFIHVYFENLII